MLSVAVFGTPVNFRGAVGERKVTFSWSPSSGSVSIIAYIVTCTPSPATLLQFFPKSEAHRFSEFSPQTSYNCSVAAYSNQTVGLPATAVFTSIEDSEVPFHILGIFITVIIIALSCGYFSTDTFFNIELAAFIVCPELSVSCVDNIPKKLY